MTHYVRYALGLLIALLLLLVPFAYARISKANHHNLRVVTEGKLYRSGQLSLHGLRWALHDHCIRTVITLRAARDADEGHPDAAEQEYCEKNDIRYFRLPAKAWTAANGKAPAEENVKRFLEIVRDPKNQPVLVHCYAGKHRTGAFCAIYRMEIDGWSNERAIQEMEANGYDQIEEHRDLLGFLQKYQPRSR